MSAHDDYLDPDRWLYDQDEDQCCPECGEPYAVPFTRDGDKADETVRDRRDRLRKQEQAEREENELENKLAADWDKYQGTRPMASCMICDAPDEKDCRHKIRSS